jgi:hypothetical protein
MTPYDRCASPARVASSNQEPGMTLAIPRTRQVALCGISSVRPKFAPHYRTGPSLVIPVPLAAEFPARVIHRASEEVA